jgi:hypothetical protein
MSYTDIRSFVLAASLCAALTCAQAQENSAAAPTAEHAVTTPAPQEPAEIPQTIDKRVFGVLPNYRTADGSLPFSPISSGRKLTIAAKDSFDWPVYITSALFCTLYQLENQNPSFGQGMAGYGRRYGTALADQVIGNMMTEGFMPILFREDPRYFRRGDGSKKSRAFYALTRIFVTKTDSGRTTFNFAEVVGNSAATAISNAYYPDTRTVHDNAERLGVALATDAFSQVAKEFWPDVKRKLFKKRDEER